MTKCILVFNELEKCLELIKTLEDKSITLLELSVIKPVKDQISTNQKKLIDEKEGLLKLKNIENIRILNPKLDRKLRQQDMRVWLIPFGFIAGLTFSNMTNLSTFSFLGLNNFGESLFGGFLGMGSGYIGSIFAAGSINLNRNKELRSIINLNKEGKWLILLENQIGYELPWILLRESEPQDIIYLDN